jgi:glycosyltransferase involved in cell wall biosynthesis
VNELISVIMPAYNAAPYVGEAIDSVLSQDYEPIELIVADDGSDDGTGEIVKSYSAVRYFFQPNAGNGAARNRAIREARGDFFAFVDADDRFTPGKLTLQKEALDADPTLDMVFGMVREFMSPELDEAVRRSIRPPAPEPMPWLSPNVMLIRRAAFERVGLFSDSLRVAVTVDWSARASEAGLRHTVLPQIVLERRLHDQNNGLRERDSRSQYLQVLRAAMERRRAMPRSEKA